MKKTVLSLAVLFSITGLTACGPDVSVPATQEEMQHIDVKNHQFTEFSTNFIDSLWQQFPTWALYSGFHKFDSILVIPNEDSRNKTIAFVKQQRLKLENIAEETLSTNQVIDYRLIENLLDSLEWNINRGKSWQWDPSKYNVAGGFAQIINEDFAPLDERLKSVLGRLENVPAYYEAARQNIHQPTIEHTQLAIQQNKGVFSVLSDKLLEKVNDSSLPTDDKALFKKRFDSAITAVNQQIEWLTILESKLAKEGSRSFRIGEKLYEEKFALNIQSGMSAKQLYQKAVADKDNIQAEMAKLTDKLWSKYFDTKKPEQANLAIKQLIDKLSSKHVKRENFVEEVKAQIPALVKFVNDKNLITLDPSKPLVVRKTPEYMRGFAGASISAPGPYDKKGNTYYNVTPLDGMSDEQAESYLREYNHWILQVLNIHEAIPGHYTQLVYSNESPSLVKSLFGNGAMVEGWAVYTERMMLEQGYGDMEPEMWLMYYKWNLRVICNTILDYSIQTQEMTKDEALSLMMDEAFQQQAEAEGKWRRATLSQVQLTSYYSGYREIYDFREEYKKLKGDDFNLKTFHEKFLSYGSAPVKYIRQLMLAEL
ncbi:DUF885 domain-containing protein [Parashewanella spongiae]|uniref:DUF885 domain-containing protein n=1 Tax=Parashewanella spongiae TaxID=342950 RepID=A0A3A6U9Y7_9GAMM|nr:DUF885 domain-containing protein [Parashewanella spongiae]MCL1077360.1 DUF885 domain-containing protein [Parashewanella spongiae]RJY18327.1 DUF885 domain-containing protein [Parashewanella spongiae]